MTVPEHLRYTKEHEWLDPDGRVGITDYAQDSLGDIVFVELPEVGRTLKAGEAFGTVESVKSVSELYSPASGRVAEVNQALGDHPETINQDPYGAGWILRIEVADAPELLSAEQYRRHIEGA
jgi:glycine cleavage system H protein